MQRDRTARRRIQQYLIENGPVSDPSGYATSLLKDAIEYSGSPVAFIQLVASMDRAGELSREIRGKRTYRIASTSEVRAPVKMDNSPPVAAEPQPSIGVQIDYERFARAIVRELMAVSLGESTARAALATAEQDALRAERDEYARRLEAARRSLDELLGAEAAALLDAPS